MGRMAGAASSGPTGVLVPASHRPTVRPTTRGRRGVRWTPTGRDFAARALPRCVRRPTRWGRREPLFMLLRVEIRTRIIGRPALIWTGLFRLNLPRFASLTRSPDTLGSEVYRRVVLGQVSGHDARHVCTGSVSADSAVDTASTIHWSYVELRVRAPGPTRTAGHVS